MRRYVPNFDFFKGAFALAASVILTKILGVMFKIPLSYVLTDEGMGYFNVAYSVYGFFYVLSTAGVPKAVTILISEYNSENKGDFSKQIAYYASRLFTKIGAMLALVFALISPLLCRLIGSDKSLYTMLSIAPSIVFVALSGALRGYMNSKGRLIAVALSQVIEGVIKLGVGLLLALAGVKLNAPLHVISSLAILGITLGCAVSAVYLLVISKITKTEEKAEQRIPISKFKVRRRLLKIAAPISFSSSVLSVAAVVDMGIIIRGLQTLGMNQSMANAAYGNYTTLAVPMFNLVISVLTPIATAFLPRLSSAFYSADELSFRKEFKELSLITLLISAPSACLFYLYSFELLDVLFPVTSAAISAELLTFLSFGVILLSNLTVVNTALESRGKIKATVLSLSVGACVKIFVSYYLMTVCELGIMGAPIGTVFSYLVSLCISLLALGRHGLSVKNIAATIMLTCICFIAFAIPYVFIYARTAFDSSFLNMLAAICASCLIYAFVIACHFALKAQKTIRYAQKD